MHKVLLLWDFCYGSLENKAGSLQSPISLRGQSKIVDIFHNHTKPTLGGEDVKAFVRSLSKIDISSWVTNSEIQFLRNCMSLVYTEFWMFITLESLWDLDTWHNPNVSCKTWADHMFQLGDMFLRMYRLNWGAHTLMGEGSGSVKGYILYGHGKCQQLWTVPKTSVREGHSCYKQQKCTIYISESCIDQEKHGWSTDNIAHESWIRKIVPTCFL